MFGVLWIGGFKQGLQWAAWGTGNNYAQYHDNLSQLPFLATVEQMWWWWFWRMASGVILFVGCALFAFNIFNTVILEREAHGKIS